MLCLLSTLTLSLQGENCIPNCYLCPTTTPTGNQPSCQLCYPGFTYQNGACVEVTFNASGKPDFLLKNYQTTTNSAAPSLANCVTEYTLLQGCDICEENYVKNAALECITPPEPSVGQQVYKCAAITNGLCSVCLEGFLNYKVRSYQFSKYTDFTKEQLSKFSRKPISDFENLNQFSVCIPISQHLTQFVIEINDGKMLNAYYPDGDDKCKTFELSGCTGCKDSSKIPLTGSDTCVTLDACRNNDNSYPNEDDTKCLTYSTPTFDNCTNLRGTIQSNTGCKATIYPYVVERDDQRQILDIRNHYQGQYTGCTSGWWNPDLDDHFVCEGCFSGYNTTPQYTCDPPSELSSTYSDPFDSQTKNCSENISGCSKCAVDNDRKTLFCLSCGPGLTWEPILGACVADCSGDRVYRGENNYCYACYDNLSNLDISHKPVKNCKTCDGAGKCLTCFDEGRVPDADGDCSLPIPPYVEETCETFNKVDFYFKCIDQCPEEFIAVDGKCVKKNCYCLTYNENVCATCVAGYFNHQGDCVTQCPEGSSIIPGTELTGGFCA